MAAAFESADGRIASISLLRNPDNSPISSTPSRFPDLFGPLTLKVSD